MTVARIRTLQVTRIPLQLGAVLGACLATSPVAVAAPPAIAWGTTTSAPAGSRAELLGVAATSATDVLAVGTSTPAAPARGATTAYAEHWNGTTWTATTVPPASKPGSGETTQLNGVASVSGVDAWSVGVVANPSSLASATLAYHWDGMGWTRIVTPDPGGAGNPNSLSAVAQRATNDVWAVGSYGFPARSLLIHYDGSRWDQIAVPDIGGLTAVLTRPGAVVVAGGDRVEQYAGGSWTALPPLPVPVGEGLTLSGVAENSSGLWAAGTADQSCGEGGVCTSSYAAVWTGHAWTAIAGGGENGFSGVSASAGEVLAASGSQIWKLTISGSTVEVTPILEGLDLNAIAFGADGTPWAVGSSPSGTAQVPAILNAPGIGQGGIAVATGAAGADISWIGPASGTGAAGVNGSFSVGGLPAGTYTIVATLPGCRPASVRTIVHAGLVSPVAATIAC